MATWSKDFLLEFVELFRREECLWKAKLKDYYNRSKKDASYRTLIGKVQAVEPDATSVCIVAFFFWTARDVQIRRPRELPVRTSSHQEQRTMVDHSAQPVRQNARRLFRT